MDDVEHVGSYRVRVPRSGQRPSLTTDLGLGLDLATNLSHTVHALGGDRWTGLRNDTLTLYAGTEEMTSTPVSRWVTAEVAVEGGHILPHEGQWYEIGDRHSGFLRQEVSRTLNRPPSVVLPPWAKDRANGTAATASQPSSTRVWCCWTRSSSARGSNHMASTGSVTRPWSACPMDGGARAGRRRDRRQAAAPHR
ncbi:hypothetical protein G3I24_05880 [Micromonospora aurantiaca]|nr:hypothetical protein [Micromonospora aurantiaca]